MRSSGGDGSRCKEGVRCAIYTRKSSEEGLEQEFNSLQAQREACEAFTASQRRELSAGGRWIRTSGTAAQRPWISAAFWGLRGHRRAPKRYHVMVQPFLFCISSHSIEPFAYSVLTG
jgi:hypothetical protein